MKTLLETEITELVSSTNLIADRLTFFQHKLKEVLIFPGANSLYPEVDDFPTFADELETLADGLEQLSEDVISEHSIVFWVNVLRVKAEQIRDLLE